jgi:hypothetical protein
MNRFVLAIAITITLLILIGAVVLFFFYTSIIGNSDAAKLKREIKEIEQAERIREQSNKPKKKAEFTIDTIYNQEESIAVYCGTEVGDTFVIITDIGYIDHITPTDYILKNDIYPSRVYESGDRYLIPRLSNIILSATKDGFIPFMTDINKVERPQDNYKHVLAGEEYIYYEIKELFKTQDYKVRPIEYVIP